jgi:hypothetical protein
MAGGRFAGLAIGTPFAQTALISEIMLNDAKSVVKREQ